MAQSDRALVMYETRLEPTIYFPREDISVAVEPVEGMRTFCPFKGTATYWNLKTDNETIEAGAWSYENALTESKQIEGYLALMPAAFDHIEIAGDAPAQSHSNISGPTIDWIMRQAGFANSPEALTKALAERFVEDGIALSRMSVLIWSLHPLIAGKNYIWEKGVGDIKVSEPSYDLFSHPAYVNSPLRHVSEGLGGVRQRLDADEMEFEFPVMADLKAAGATDYVAMPLFFSNGQINVMTIASDHPNGFTTANLGLIFECSGVISRFFEVFTLSENANSLLSTYLGPRTGARVLGGEIRRGDGEEIEAAVLMCDLRHSSRLEEELSRQDYLNVLNQFFELASDVISAHDGEVLKFIGDAVLAIFPTTGSGGADEANTKALHASAEILKKIDEHHVAELDGSIDCALGVDFGKVTYGNVGSAGRLDFTVIGSAANVAARLADLGKDLGHRAVASLKVAKAHKDQLHALGCHDLRNVEQPVEVYGIPAKQN